MDARASVELFHLLLLQAFGQRVSKDLFALKGGCNLRFYFKSVRYSQDMDLDIKTMSVATLQNNMQRILEGVPFLHALRGHGLELIEHSAPKQTATTQRWKISIRHGSGPALHTKVEFSRRRFEADTHIAPVDAEFARRYRLYTVLSQHYGLKAAVAQKVAALAGRSETQARDVFDLKLLLDAGAMLGGVDTVLRTKAATKALEIGHADFVAQVVAYLEPDYADHYRRKAAWDSLQSEVVDRLAAS